MQIKVDYHFHPNFPLFIPFLGRSLANKRARAIWKAFEKNKMDVVLITEHSYKHPKKSFEILELNKPRNAKTLIVPGIEVLTKEGTDLIVFSKNKQDVYSYSELLIPWKLKMAEVVKMISQKDSLKGIVVHLYTPGATGIIKNNGIEEAKKAIKQLGFVEFYNCSFTALIQLFDSLRLNKILKKKYVQMINTATAPNELCYENTIVTGGSDAHHPSEIGDYMEIECDNAKNFFDIITTKSGKIIRRKKYILTLIPNTVTVSREWLMKKLHLYTVDKPL
ncbi:MAG: hypothetical protein WCX95_03335 [Candidatus Gracilibacteria bacterium]